MSMPSYPQQMRPRKRRVWPWLLLGLLVLMLGGCLAAVAVGVDTANRAASTTAARTPFALPVVPAHSPTTTPAPPPTPAGPAAVIRKDGTYVIGVDIQPGTWRTEGASFCYWERVKNLSGGVGSILDNSAASGQQVVTILPTDKAFKSRGCGTWTLVPD
ncbi:hypothetical protein [Nocardia thraciensis]